MHSRPALLVALAAVFVSDAFAQVTITGGKISDGNEAYNMLVRTSIHSGPAPPQLDPRGEVS